jgi:hypothetical protein
MIPASLDADFEPDFVEVDELVDEEYEQEEDDPDDDEISLPNRSSQSAKKNITSSSRNKRGIEPNNSMMVATGRGSSIITPNTSHMMARFRKLWY